MSNGTNELKERESWSACQDGEKRHVRFRKPPSGKMRGAPPSRVSRHSLTQEEEQVVGGRVTLTSHPTLTPTLCLTPTLTLPYNHR